MLLLVLLMLLLALVLLVLLFGEQMVPPCEFQYAVATESSS